ncbi:hypothetical protein TNCV_4294591 [Trichonephila clavipes]|uniref:Uncharacterized protein n=1 Tax=Trichonephila clavipes TaxID=2585209 RepID=A0A8X6RGX3_TRICX|nr:hypothetical protein TNCV_4294591 [Trichonephila clavipes]
MSLDLSSMSLDPSSMSLDPSSMSLDLSSMSLDRSSMSLDPRVKTIFGRPLFHLTCQEFHLWMTPVSIESRPERQRWTGWLCGILGFKRESRPYMQRGGIKTGEKGHDSYKKSRVPFGPEMQLLDKKYVKKGQESGKTSRLKAKDGNKTKRIVWRSIQMRWFQMRQKPFQIPVSEVPQSPVQSLPEPMQILPELDILNPMESTDAFDQLMSFVFGPQELQLLHTVPSIFDGNLFSFLDEFERVPMDLTMPRLNSCVKKSIGFKPIQPMDLSVNSCL